MDRIMASIMEKLQIHYGKYGKNNGHYGYGYGYGKSCFRHYGPKNMAIIFQGHYGFGTPGGRPPLNPSLISPT